MSVAKSFGQSERIAVYEVPDDELAIGSTLGSPKAVCIIKATGAIQKIYSTDAGKDLFGSLTWHVYDVNSGIHLTRGKGGSFLIHPEHQEHHYTLSGNVSLRENIFVLSGELGENGSVDPPAVYCCITLTNNDSEPIDLAVNAAAELRGNTVHDMVAHYDPALHALTAWNESAPDQARVFGCSAPPDSYEVVQDAGKTVSGRYPGPLSGQIVKCSHPLGILNHTCHLDPGQAFDLYYLLSFGKGRQEAVANYKACPPADQALQRTKKYYHDVLQRAVVFSPNEEVNRGVLWAKANMLRILIQSPTGWCFVNDPTKTNNSVARDTAWFAYGADYIRPSFTRDSLLAFVQRQEQSGLVIEYYDIRGGKTEDYGLNINDNTPLLILALWHFYSSSGDRSFLNEVYPAVAKAAHYILTQQNEQGLVWCSADGTSDFGIIGWRNVIKNYRLSGATTEANSECYAALLAASKMARLLGKHEESGKFGEEAQKLKEAINRYLKNPENGLYYLNIDLDGVPRTDVTSDLVFPVIFGVSDEPTSIAIIRRLSGEDFWTASGLRTTPRYAPDYNPDGRSDGPYGLLGGVWVGVSFWFAFAAAPYNAEFMDRALSDSFQNYSTDPRRNNTVPGQFSEWLHGETLSNEGMMLSPWFPPRYLWAAIEGAGGLEIEGDLLKLHPRLAPHWKWLGVRNLPYRNRSLAWLAVRMPDPNTPLIQLYTTFYPDESLPYEAYDEDITDDLEAQGEYVCSFGLRRGHQLLFFVGSTTNEAVTTSLRAKCSLDGKYRVRFYDSLIEKWEDQGLMTAKEIQRGQLIQIEQRGFCLLQLTQET